MKRIALMTLVAAFVAGCGGGGGSGGSSYTGNTSPAVVTRENARELSVDVLEGSEVAQSLSETQVAAKQSEVAGVQQVLPVLLTLEGMAAEAFSGKETNKAVTSISQGTRNGTSGNYTYSVDYNQITGETAGTLAFRSYQAIPVDPIMNGTVTFQGTYDAPSNRFSRLLMNLSDLQVVTGSNTSTLRGSLAISTAGATTTLTMSIVRNEGGASYMLENFSLQLTGNSLTMAGRYYHHRYGYVDVTTEAPLTTADLSALPTAGRLLFSGANGTGARLTYTGAAQLLEVYDTVLGQYQIVPF